MAMLPRAIAGVGSSKTPDIAGGELTRTVQLFSDAGFWLYSGGAFGADLYSEAGANPKQKLIFYGNPRHKMGDRGYVPIPPQDTHNILIKPGPLKEKAAEVMGNVVDASHWQNIVAKGDFVSNLYTRNTFQVLGPDLKSPVEAVVCWATADQRDGTVQGGTKGAVRLAQRLNIPWYNLAIPEHRKKLAAYIQAGFPAREPAELAKTYIAMIELGVISREEALERGVQLEPSQQQTQSSAPDAGTSGADLGEDLFAGSRLRRDTPTAQRPATPAAATNDGGSEVAQERPNIFTRLRDQDAREKADRPEIERQAKAWLAERGLELPDGGRMFPNEYDGRFPGTIIGKTDAHYAFALGLNPPRELYYVSREHVKDEAQVGDVAAVVFAPRTQKTIVLRAENAPDVFPINVETHRRGFLGEWIGQGAVNLGLDYSPLSSGLDKRSMPLERLHAEYQDFISSRILDNDRRIIEELNRLAEIAHVMPLTLGQAPNEAHGDIVVQLVAERARAIAATRKQERNATPDISVPAASGTKKEPLFDIPSPRPPMPAQGQWHQNWFSNMIPFETPLVVDGISYRTPEHFYQAQKSLDLAVREQVAAIPQPGNTKRFARTIALRPDWETVKDDVMRQALLHRFAPGTKAREQLLATGRNEICEWNNWGDKTWGRTISDGAGQNRLGILLMELRAQIVRDRELGLDQSAPTKEQRMEQLQATFSPQQRAAIHADQGASQDAWTELALEVRNQSHDVVVTNGRVYRVASEDAPSFGRGFGGQGWTVQFLDGTVRHTTNLIAQGDIPERFLDTLPQNGAIYQDPFRDNDPATLGWSEHNGKRYQNVILPTTEMVLIQPGPIGTNTREILKWDDPRAVAFLEREAINIAKHFAGDTGRVDWAVQGDARSYEGPVLWAREAMFVQRVGDSVVIHRDKQPRYGSELSPRQALIDQDVSFRVSYPGQQIEALRENVLNQSQLDDAIAYFERNQDAQVRAVQHARGAMAIGPYTLLQTVGTPVIQAHSMDVVNDATFARIQQLVDRHNSRGHSSSVSTIEAGNLFDSQAEAMVNTVNVVGVMGKGIAKEFKRLYPDMFMRYRAKCASKELKPGVMDIYDRGAGEQPRYVINFPTKRDWRDDSRIEDVRAGLDALVDQVNALGIKSIAIPPLGCGNGNLNWADVEPLIQQAASRMPNTLVEVYAPTRAREVKHAAAQSPTVVNDNGFILGKGLLSSDEITQIEHDIRAIENAAPFSRFEMPNGSKFRVEMTAAGTVGWVSDKDGYRYDVVHPITKNERPAVPKSIESAARRILTHFGLDGSNYAIDCALINRYTGQSSLGVHQDRDEHPDAKLSMETRAWYATKPVVSFSFGASCDFKVGTKTYSLGNGDVCVLSGEARLAPHGVSAVHGEQRINITLRELHPKILEAAYERAGIVPPQHIIDRINGAQAKRSLAQIDPAEVGLHPISVGNDNRGDKGEYIGRGGRNHYPRSPLANPFEIGKAYNDRVLIEAGVPQATIARFNEQFRGRVFERGDTIELYRAWLSAKIKNNDATVMNELARLTASAKERPLQVVCHCAPAACHGDVVKQAVVLVAKRQLEAENARVDTRLQGQIKNPQAERKSAAGGMGR